MIQPVTEPDPPEQLGGSRFGAVIAAKLERHLDVLKRGQCRDQLKTLENEPNFLAAEPRARILVHPREILVVEEHAAAGWGIQSSKKAEQCRLSAPRRTDDCHEGALRQAEIHVAEHGELVLSAAILFCQVTSDEHDEDEESPRAMGDTGDRDCRVRDPGCMSKIQR